MKEIGIDEIKKEGNKERQKERKKEKNKKGKSMNERNIYFTT